MQKKYKGIILSGGTGTRLLPVTSVTSKQLLPVYDKPLIYYPLSTLMSMGIAECMIVSNPSDVGRFQELFGDGSHLGIQMQYGIQKTPLGIAHALLEAKNFIGDDSVVLILGDNLFCGDALENTFENIEFPEEGATVFACKVTHPERYGIFSFEEDRPVAIIEKPQNPPSSFAATGLYFYDNRVLEIAQNLKPSWRGELEITDVNNAYLQQGDLRVMKLPKDSVWFDAGHPDDLLKAANYIQEKQTQENRLIGCPEEIAFRKGFINEKQLHKLASSLQKSRYGSYLKAFLEKKALVS